MFIWNLSGFAWWAVGMQKYPEGIQSPLADLFPIFLLLELQLCHYCHPDQKPHVYCPGHMVENISLGQPCIRFPAWRDKILSVQTQRLSLKRFVFAQEAALPHWWQIQQHFEMVTNHCFWFCCFNVHFPPLSTALGSFVKVILTTSAHIALPQTERQLGVPRAGNLKCFNWALRGETHINHTSWVMTAVPSWYYRCMFRELNKHSFNWPDPRLVQQQGTTQSYWPAGFQLPK